MANTKKKLHKRHTDFDDEEPPKKKKKTEKKIVKSLRKSTSRKHVISSKATFGKQTRKNSKSSKKCHKYKKEKCQICGQLRNNPGLVYQGHPQYAVEESIALTNENLVAYSDGKLMERPQINLSNFSIYDQEGHLCPPDRTLVIKNSKIYLSGYLNSICSDSVGIEEAIPVKDIGPFMELYISAFSARNKNCMTISTICADYNLQNPSEQYKPVMDSHFERIKIGDIIARFLQKYHHLKPTLKNLIGYLKYRSAVELKNKKITKKLLCKHAPFMCEQIRNLTNENNDNNLITLPCMKKFIRLTGVDLDEPKKRTKTQKDTKSRPKATKATTTPLVRKAFEKFFTKQLDATNQGLESQRCGICKTCQLPDCGVCNACRGMAKFGGSGRHKTTCVKRICPKGTEKQDEESDKEADRSYQKGDYYMYDDYMKLKWIGEPVQIDARKIYYDKVEVNDLRLCNGDYVILKTRYPHVPYLVARVAYIWKEKYFYPGEGFIHAEVFIRSEHTILGNVGDPREVFLHNRCIHGVPLSGIMRKAYVEKKEASPDWFNFSETVEEKRMDDDGKTYFYNKLYSLFTGRFEDLPEDPTCPNRFRKHRFCPSCERKTKKDDKVIPIIKGERLVRSPLVPVDRTEWDVISWRGNDYKKGCAVFLRWGSFKLKNYTKVPKSTTDMNAGLKKKSSSQKNTNEKRSNQKILKSKNNDNSVQKDVKSKVKCSIQKLQKLKGKSSGQKLVKPMTKKCSEKSLKSKSKSYVHKTLKTKNKSLILKPKYVTSTQKIFQPKSKSYVQKILKLKNNKLKKGNKYSNLKILKPKNKIYTEKVLRPERNKSLEYKQKPGQKKSTNKILKLMEKTRNTERRINTNKKKSSKNIIKSIKNICTEQTLKLLKKKLQSKLTQVNTSKRKITSKQIQKSEDNSLSRKPLKQNKENKFPADNKIATRIIMKSKNKKSQIMLKLRNLRATQKQIKKGKNDSEKTLNQKKKKGFDEIITKHKNKRPTKTNLKKVKYPKTKNTHSYKLNLKHDKSTRKILTSKDKRDLLNQKNKKCTESKLKTKNNTSTDKIIKAKNRKSQKILNKVKNIGSIQKILKQQKSLKNRCMTPRKSKLKNRIKIQKKSFKVKRATANILKRKDNKRTQKKKAKEYHLKNESESTNKLKPEYKRNSKKLVQENHSINKSTSSNKSKPKDKEFTQKKLVQEKHLKNENTTLNKLKQKDKNTTHKKLVEKNHSKNKSTFSNKSKPKDKETTQKKLLQNNHSKNKSKTSSKLKPKDKITSKKKSVQKNDSKNKCTTSSILNPKYEKALQMKLVQENSKNKRTTANKSKPKDNITAQRKLVQENYSKNKSITANKLKNKRTTPKKLKPQNKRTIQKKTKLKKVNEDVYTEYYRKKYKNIGGSNVYTREPFCVGYIEAVSTTGYGDLLPPQNYYLTVKIMYRPENTSVKYPHREDLNTVYWSEDIRHVPFSYVTGLCHLIYANNVPEGQSLQEWLDEDPSRFYFKHAYNRAEKCMEKVPKHATAVGKIEKEKETAEDISKSKVRPLRTLDVFAGCGGLSEGLDRAGVAECRWAIENCEVDALAYSSNNKSCTVFTDDCNVLLRDVMAGAKYRGGLKLPMRGDVEMLCGGPPCQGFSGMNRFTSRDASKFKNSLIATFLSYCDYYRPKYLILENVRDFAAFKRGMVLKLTMRALLDMGYQCSFGVLQAGHYGVPQSRRRLILLAAAPGHVLPLFPEPTHVFSPKAGCLSIMIDKKRFTTNIRWETSAPRRTVTVGDAISDLPPIKKGANRIQMNYRCMPLSQYQRMARRSTTKVSDHVSKKMAPLVQARIDRIPTAPGSDWRDLPNIAVELSDGTKCNVLQYRYEDIRNGRSSTGAMRGVCACASGARCLPQEKQSNTLIPWFLPHTANRHAHWAGVYGRISWSGYFNTIITDPEPTGKQGRVLHPAQSRVVSVRECARAQRFPDHYVFTGTVQDKYRQIGNAVPPPLGEAIGREVKKSILGIKPI